MATIKPLLNKLFETNKNILRIKVWEIVPENTTESKSHLILWVSSFKTDLQILVNIYQEEFNLVCGEGCLQSALDNKIAGDKSKLLREEKEPELAIRKICKKSIDSKSWLCQWIELHCHFSTVHITKHKYLVNIPEFSPEFPWSFLGFDGVNRVKYLFTF